MAAKRKFDRTKHSVVLARTQFQAEHYLNQQIDHRESGGVEYREQRWTFPEGGTVQASGTPLGPGYRPDVVYVLPSVSDYYQNQLEYEGYNVERI